MTVSKDAGAAMHDGRVGWRRLNMLSFYLFIKHFLILKLLLFNFFFRK